ncbi:hypothetical protein AOP6_1211 [Desulfuromonas sp. AOP6]|nr:hypothetical protein AOP6_1211 [Desulfuromonas sp. AOP6]
MLASLFLICLVLLLNEIAIRSMSPPSQDSQLSEMADPIEERFGAGLSWKLGMAVSERVFQVSLKDEAGYPVKEATVRLVILGRDGEKVSVQRLEERVSGLYVGPLPDLEHRPFQAGIEAVTPQGRIMKTFMIQF